MAVLVTKWFGTFLVDERTNRIIDKRLMPSDPDTTAEKLAAVQRGAVLDEEKELAARYPKIYVSDRRQSDLGKPMLYDSSFIRPEMFGFTDAAMHEVMIKLGKLRSSEPISKDKNLVQAIRGMDDLIETANLLNERLHEWYGMHFPELADISKDERTYSELVSKFGQRDAVLQEFELDIESIGAEFDKGDMIVLKNFASTLCQIYEERDRMEEYVSGIVSDVCPNMCALLGGPLSARLISLAGGLDRLASLPSSTVQLLGAEKAMFRHLRSGKNPPKHGVIYQHPEVHRAPYWQRGKIARALAGKVSIAAKIDGYGGEFRGDGLSAAFATRVEDIKRIYPEPPKKKPSKKGGKSKKGKPRR